MTTRRRMLQVLIAVAASSAFWLGCTSQKPDTSGAPPTGPSPGPSTPQTDRDQPAGAEHDPDDVPITEKDVEMPADYTALVVRIEQLVGDIRDKIAAGMPSKAHRSLDELEIILKKAPEIASKSIAKEHWKEVNVQSKELAAAHQELHEKIDEKQNPDYATVAERIQKALEALKAVPN